MASAIADEDSWKGSLSFYTPIIQKIETSWPISGLSELNDQKELLKIEAIETEGHPFFIGAVQMMIVKAPMLSLSSFLDHFADYPKYFDGLKKAEVRDSKVENGKAWSRVYFEQSVPVPFVPNDKSEMIYHVDSSNPSRRVYRYQYRTGNNLISDDGIIILDVISTRLTRYVEFDFWDANWGIAKTLGQKKIWSDSLKGLAQSDLSIKIMAENPSMSAEQVLKDSKKMANAYPAEHRFDHKIDSKKWFKAHGIDLGQ